MYFCVNELEVGVNDSLFPGNEQQNVYKMEDSRTKINFTYEIFDSHTELEHFHL